MIAYNCGYMIQRTLRKIKKQLAICVIFIYMYVFHNTRLVLPDFNNGRRTSCSLFIVCIDLSICYVK